MYQQWQRWRPSQLPSSKAAVKFQLFKIHIHCIALENSVKINFDNLMINFLSFTWLFWIGFQSRFIYIKSIRTHGLVPTALRTERLGRGWDVLGREVKYRIKWPRSLQVVSWSTTISEFESHSQQTFCISSSPTPFNVNFG